MPTFSYRKLVRDNIPSFHDEAGHTTDVTVLRGQALSAALVTKLHEEADEVSAALQPEEFLEELADVQQIIDDLCALHGVSEETLRGVVTKKAAKKGGFQAGYYIETVTMPRDDDEWVAYCRKSPDKYPEIDPSL